VGDIESEIRDWADERFIKVFVRDTPNSDAWPWESRAIIYLILRKCSRVGLYKIDNGESLGKPMRLRKVAANIRMPPEVVTPGVAGLLEDGVMAELRGGYFFPNFHAAQESKSSDRERQRKTRETRLHRLDLEAMLGRAAVTKRDARTSDGLPDPAPTPPRELERMGDAPLIPARAVTERDAQSQPVSACHANSAAVTPCRAVPSKEDLGATVEARAARAEASPEKSETRSVGRSVEGADPRQLEIVPVTPLRPVRAPEAKAALEVRVAAPADEWTYDRFWSYLVRCEKRSARPSLRPKNGPRVYVAMRAEASPTVLFRAAQAFFTAPDSTHPYAATFFKVWRTWVDVVRNGDEANAPCQFCADEDAHDLLLEGVFFRTCTPCEGTFETETKGMEGTPAELMGTWAAQRAVG
jgi:hypothetical protein